ncbi:Phosphotransferase enzyme family protein [Amphibacillus marinus]|uniref:Phosphotransferase enzyme family protein n=1 Tax=Amphibacillus marinus TaxID=872970 RepID=A0A1H8KCD4_9BACI|nr:aminoglycoside phosphotransferase family protein [Amphibacillus marinus]SEN90156.1 Phosphotransferase enzyme family protein [Amphibacillus marinus]
MIGDLKKAIGQGNTADVYVQEDRVIKLYKSHFSEEIATYEESKLAFAYQKGLQVPKPLGINKIDGKIALLMAFVEGKTLGQLIETDMDLLDHYLGVSIDVQQKMHAINAVGLEPMADKLARQIKSAGLLTDSEKTALLMQLNSKPMENKLCHGDFHCYNLIEGKTGVTIIDWLDASAGQPLADVCRTYLLYGGFAPAVAECYLTLYLGKTAHKQADILIWLPIIAGARLSESLPESEQDRLVQIVRAHLLNT